MPHDHKYRGFTLIELLVSILLITITLSMIQLSTGSDNRPRLVKQEAERISTLIAFASDEAVMFGRELGLYLLENRYQFMQFKGEAWIPYTENTIFRERTLPEGSQFELIQQGMSVSLKKEMPNSEEGITPQIFILSSGERSPFELTLSIESGYRQTITGEIFGDLIVSVEGGDSYGSQ